MDAQFIEHIRQYYSENLPFDLIFQWLNHGLVAQRDFTHREFAFEYPSGAYQRYNSFLSTEEFKAKVVKSNPMRFEVGAVYPIEPKDRKSVSKAMMKPESKEVVMDVDLTDYDDIRKCCSGTSICSKCWKFMELAMDVVETALEEDFGIEHKVWVFSGRRGIHCWISDQNMRGMNEQARRAFIEYMDVLNVKSKAKRVGALGLKKPFHPHIERSLKILQGRFVEIVLREQNTWQGADGSKKLLELIPDFKLRNSLKAKWALGDFSSTEKWTAIDSTYKELRVQSFDLVDWKKEVILLMLYPRLDVEVSRQMNHLLKSPFCVHPGTGNVCVPFDPKAGFDPFTQTPRLENIVNNDQHDKDLFDNSVTLFRKYVKGLLVAESNDHKRARDTNAGLDF